MYVFLREVMSSPRAPYVYKLMTPSDWASMQRDGFFDGSPHDKGDGFMHFSDAAEVPLTARLYYKGTVALLKIDVAKLGPEVEMRWDYVAERSTYFPHMFAVPVGEGSGAPTPTRLLMAAVVAVCDESIYVDFLETLLFVFLLQK